MYYGPRWLSRYRESLRAFKVWGSHPSGSEIFRTPPELHSGLPSLLYSGYRVSFAGVKRTGRGLDHPPPSSAEVNPLV